MELVSIFPPIYEDQKFPQAVTKQVENFFCKFAIQKNEETGMHLVIECEPVNASKYWECSISFDVGMYKGIISRYEKKTPTFSNYNNVITVIQLDDDVTGVLLKFQCPKLQVFEFRKELLFDEPVENITDFKFIVERQPLYVCKKILATYSKYMHDWFDDECSQTEMIIPDATCNSFRVFLGVLLNKYNMVTDDNHQTIAVLARFYRAESCNQMAGFTEKLPKLTDVVLLVGDRKFHVSKQLLAYHSSYFHTMFYSAFIEKGKDEVELKEIDPNEFEMFLQVVYRLNPLITVKNVEALLTLSQMYNMMYLFLNCVYFLKSSEDMSEVDKIKFATRYNVPELFDRVILKLTAEDLPRLYEMDGFTDLDDNTVAKITSSLQDKFYHL